MGSIYGVSRLALLLLTVGLANCQEAEISIHRIQGSGSESAFTGRTVITSGIVTARKSNGFFLQTPVDDGDPATSEGIFVFTSTEPPAEAARGSLVRVSGTVAEFRPNADPRSPPLTQITRPTIATISTGHPLPEPVILSSDGEAAIEQWEHLEGMRVRVPLLQVVSPTGGTVNERTARAGSNGIFYGVIAEVPRPFREPGIPVLDPLPEGAPEAVPRFDGNPERLRVQSRGQPGAPSIEVTAGAMICNLTGPLDYGFRTYTIVPDADPAPEVYDLAGATAAPEPEDGEFTIASLNLQRFFDTEDDPRRGDVVLTAEAFASRLRKASLAIRDILRSPDILGVQEAENFATLLALADQLNMDSPGSPEYRAYLEEGNDPGGIDVGFLVKESRVTVLSVSQEGKDDTFVNQATGREEILNDRPPLLLRARVGDVPVTVIVNHLRSLIGIEEPRVWAKRRAQAEFLARLIQDRQEENLIVVGDFNAFPFNDGYVDVLGAVRGAPAPADSVLLASGDLVEPDLVNLLELLPAEQAYSFVFDGNAQTLDHILVNAAMRERLSRFCYARSNADFPESYRDDPDRPERLSDHDAPVAYFR